MVMIDESVPAMLHNVAGNIGRKGGMWHSLLRELVLLCLTVAVNASYLIYKDEPKTTIKCEIIFKSMRADGKIGFSGSSVFLVYGL